MADHLLHLEIKPWVNAAGDFQADIAEAHFSFTCEHERDDPKWWSCEANPCWLMLEWELAEDQTFGGSADQWPTDPQFPLPVRPLDPDARHAYQEVYIVFDADADQQVRPAEGTDG